MWPTLCISWKWAPVPCGLSVKSSCCSVLWCSPEMGSGGPEVVQEALCTGIIHKSPPLPMLWDLLPELPSGTGQEQLSSFIPCSLHHHRSLYQALPQQKCPRAPVLGSVPWNHGVTTVLSPPHLPMDCTIPAQNSQQHKPNPKL